MASSDQALEGELIQAANKLANPPSSTDELLPLLDVTFIFSFLSLCFLCRVLRFLFSLIRSFIWIFVLLLIFLQRREFSFLFLSFSLLSILFFNVLSLPLFTLSCLYVFSPLLYQMLFHRSSPLLLTLPILSGFTVPLHGDDDACNPQVTHLFSFPPFIFLIMAV